jgi:TolA-binding protein
MTDFELQVKMALAKQGKATLRNQVDQAYVKYLFREKKQRFYALAAAAMLIVALAAVGFWGGTQASNPQQLAWDYYASPTFTDMRDAKTTHVLWQKAVLAYDHKSYAEAAELLKKVLGDPQFTETDFAYLYLGLSQMSDNRPQEAAKSFANVRKSSMLYPDAQWYQALAILASDDSKQAHLVLGAIAQDDSHHQQRHAAEILEKLGE